MGTVIPDLINPLYPGLIRYMESFAAARGYEVLITSTAYDPTRTNQCIDRMLHRKVDGVALMISGVENQLQLSIAERGVPLVCMELVPSFPGRYAIVIDYDVGLQQAVQHLAALHSYPALSRTHPPHCAWQPLSRRSAGPVFAC